MLYKEKAQYAYIGKMVNIEVEDNGDFKVFSKDKIYQSGNLKDYYVSNRGFGPNVGLYIWKKFHNPRAVKDEILFYDRLMVDPSTKDYERFRDKKKRFLKVAKQFGSRSLVKIPSPLVVLAYTAFLGFMVYIMLLR